MIDPRLTKLFSDDSFQKDLPGIAMLTSSAYEAIRTTIAKNVEADASDLYLDSDSAKIAETSGLARENVHGAFVLSAAIALYEITEQDTRDIVVRFRDLLARKVPDAKPFLDHLVGLREISQKIRVARTTRNLVAVGGKTVGAISISCDLRARTRTPLPTTAEQVTAFRPEIVELLPIAVVSISFDKSDDGDDVTFQLTLDEVRILHNRLKGAESVLTAMASRAIASG